MHQAKSDMLSLKKWFLRYRRDLPWRSQPTPYRVWVSEVMLQQTQVSVVLPYFERWMARFPSIESLADAREDEVIKLWEGLGYYARARNLRTAAQQIVGLYEGKMPSCPKKLLAIKGLGPYTVGAIRAFAFGEKTIAIDGNVKRVLARYFAIKENVASTKTMKKLEELGELLLPADQPQLVTEGLIELGALVCQKVPKCGKCPLSNGCVAFKQGIAKELPTTTKRQKLIELHRQVFLVICGQYVFIQQAKNNQVMAGLWQFPYDDLSNENAINQLEQKLGGRLIEDASWPEVTHGFTRYKAILYPKIFRLEGPCSKGNGWVRIEDISNYPFCSGHRKLACQLKDW